MSGGRTGGQRSWLAVVNEVVKGSTAAPPTTVRSKEAGYEPARSHVVEGKFMFSCPVTVQRVPGTGEEPQEGLPRDDEVEVAPRL